MVSVAHRKFEERFKQKKAEAVVSSTLNLENPLKMNL
jgi:hypothetical protein